MWEACRKFWKVWEVGGAQGMDSTLESNHPVTLPEEIIVVNPCPSHSRRSRGIFRAR